MGCGAKLTSKDLLNGMHNSAEYCESNVRTSRDETTLFLQYVATSLFHRYAAQEPSAIFCVKNKVVNLRFEVFVEVTMMSAVFLDVTPCGSCKNRRFGGTYASIIRVKISELGTNSVASYY
jgi:hypothetical protein